MEREKIERLLAAYTNGEISPEDKLRMEDLLRQDPRLREEAAEMVMIWNSLEEIGEMPPLAPTADAKFHTMLAGFTEKKKPVVVLKRIGKILLPLAACIATFIIGRATVEPVEITKYKTRIVKVPLIKERVKEKYVFVNPSIASKSSETPPKENVQTYSVLERKLHSDFASERMDAIMQLSGPAITESNTLKILGDALTKDANTNVRLMVIKKLQPYLAQQPVQTLLIGSLNRQEDTMIQDAVLDLLIQARSRQAIPQMITLLENNTTSTMVQSKIKEGIERFLY